jgi:hypothetical protein
MRYRPFAPCGTEPHTPPFHIRTYECNGLCHPTIITQLPLVCFVLGFYFRIMSRFCLNQEACVHMLFGISYLIPSQRIGRTFCEYSRLVTAVSHGWWHSRFSTNSIPFSSANIPYCLAVPMSGGSHALSSAYWNSWRFFLGDLFMQHEVPVILHYYLPNIVYNWWHCKPITILPS